MSAAIFAASMTGITFGKISLGGIAASFVVLVSAGYGKESGGSVAGVAAGTAVSLASGNMSTVLSGYALGGLVSGIFSVFGKIHQYLLYSFQYLYHLQSLYETQR